MEQPGLGYYDSIVAGGSAGTDAVDFRSLPYQPSSGWDWESLDAADNPHKLVFDQNGYLGIGTNIPQKTVHIAGIDPQVRLERAATGAFDQLISSGHWTGDPVDYYFVPAQSSSGWVFVSKDGTGYWRYSGLDMAGNFTAAGVITGANLTISSLPSQGLLATDDGGRIIAGTPGAASVDVQVNGSDVLAAATAIDFEQGAGVTLSGSATGSKATVTASSTGGGGGSINVDTNGTLLLNGATSLNLAGSASISVTGTLSGATATVAPTLSATATNWVLTSGTNAAAAATNPVPGWITTATQNSTNPVPAWVQNSTNPVPGWITTATQNSTNPVPGWITTATQNSTNPVPAWVQNSTNPVPGWITTATQNSTNPVPGWITTAAQNATNGLTSALLQAKLGGSVYDASGAGTTAAQNATNALNAAAFTGAASSVAIANVSAPGVIMTNGGTTAVTYSNNVTVDAAHAFVGAFFAPTNLATTTTLTAGLAYTTNLAGNVTLANFAGIPNNQLWSIYLLCTNSAAATYTVTFPGGCVGQGQGTPPVYYVTNATRAEFQINGWGTISTNINWSPHW